MSDSPQNLPSSIVLAEIRDGQAYCASSAHKVKMALFIVPRPERKVLSR